jgi:hypothetical protein
MLLRKERHIVGLTETMIPTSGRRHTKPHRPFTGENVGKNAFWAMRDQAIVCDKELEQQKREESEAQAAFPCRSPFIPVDVSPGDHQPPANDRPS